MADAPPPPLPPGFTMDPDPVAAPPTPIIPRTPAPQTPAQASKDQSDAVTASNNAAASGFKVKQEQITTEKQQAQKDMMTEGVDRLVSSIESAKGLVNNWSTGWGAAALQHVPNTDAARLQAMIDQEIKGNVFLNTIQQRQMDTPGGTGNGTPGGRILQSEVPMITGAMGTLNPSALGEAGTMEKLNQIAYRALRAKAILNGQNPNDPVVQKQYGIDRYAALLPNADVDGGASSPPTPPSSGDLSPGAPELQNPPDIPGMSQMTPDQQARDRAFLATKPTPEQYAQFMTGLLGRPVDVAAIQDRLNAANAGGEYSGAISNRRAVEDRIAAENKAGIDQENPATRVFMHGATLGLYDEAAGAADALTNVVSSPFTGNFNPVAAYQLGRDVERQRDADAESQLGPAAIPIELAGGMVSGNPETAIARAADSIPTVSQVVRQGAKAGGAYGLIAGYGNGEGLQNSLVGAGVGGVTGAALGAAGGRLFAGKGPPTTPPGAPAAEDVANALSAEGIPAARPVADPSVRGKMAYLETTRGGHSIVQDSLAATRQSIADKVSGLSGNGQALTPGEMGEAIQNAGTSALNNTKAQATRFYDRAANASAGDAVNPTNALAELDANISDLQRNPNSNQALISYLQDVRNDLAQPGRTVADIRNLRTSLSGEINRRNLGMSNADRIMGNVLDAAGSDISRDLGKSNPEALGLYQQGDALWRQMSQDRDQVVSKLIGSDATNPISGEAAMSRVTQMMGNKGDISRFNRVMDMMGPDDRANFRATLWQNIGRRSPDEAFSPGVFVQQTRNMQPDALRTVFGDDGAQSIQNLRVAARGLQDAQGALNNSRSGFVANFKDLVGSVLSLKSGGAGAAGYAVAGLPGAAVGVVGSEVAQRAANGLSAKALMNPDVSQWIRKVATAKTDAQAQALFGKLNTLAAGNASLQPELSSFRDMLAKAMNDNFTPRAAASGSGQGQNNQN